jgi:TrmH family RNA methyltransferase
MTAPETIHSRSNPLFRQLRTLKQRGALDELMLLEGGKLVEEALAAGIQLVAVAIADGFARSPRGQALLQAVERCGIEPRLLGDSLLASVSEVETSQGVLAIARRPVFEEDEIYRGHPLVLVAMAIQNPGNLGALLRVAEAAGATGAYLTIGSADPYSWKALRGAMGSAFRLPSICAVDAKDLLQRLHSRGVVSLAAVTSGGVPYDRVEMRRPLAVWLGNEGAGLPQDLICQIEEHVTVPLAPLVESLNVAVAGGLLLFEAARQRRCTTS